MKRQGHKHKESFSILLLSNTGRGNRQFHISQSVFYVMVSLLLAVLIVIIALSVFGVSIYQRQSLLRKEVEIQKALVQQLETEKKAISEENTSLKSENEALRRLEQENALASAEDANDESAGDTVSTNQEESQQNDPAYPGLYPSSGTCIVETAYSEEHQFLSINTKLGDNIIAAGNGTITAIGSDETYAHIIEVGHGNGYKTRYLCRQQAEPLVQEGEQIQAGSTLLAVAAEDTQMDYQVLYQGVPVDPFTVIQAQG